MEKPKKKRLTKEEMEDRLDLVYKLRLRGLSFSTIGKTLGIDKSIVCRDLQRFRKRIKTKEKNLSR
jgi:transposase-like protein